MLQVGREKPPAGTGCAWDGPTDGMGLDKDVQGLAWGGWAREEDCGKEPRRPFLFHRENKGRDVKGRVRLCFPR